MTSRKLQPDILFVASFPQPSPSWSRSVPLHLQLARPRPRGPFRPRSGPTLGAQPRWLPQRPPAAITRASRCTATG